jgi:hypothetical protein
MFFNFLLTLEASQSSKIRIENRLNYGYLEDPG